MSRSILTVGVCLAWVAFTAPPLTAHQTGAAIRLSSVVPRLANQGWGVLLMDKSADGAPIRIGDRTFEHGVSTHARSDLVYLIAGRYSRLRAWVGVDATVSKPKEANAIFQVFGDGRKLFESALMKVDTPAARIDVDLERTNALRLVITYSREGTYADHADWAEAELVADSILPDSGLSTREASGAPSRVQSGALTFFTVGDSLDGFTLADGKRIDMRAHGGMGPYVSPDDSRTIEESAAFREARGGIAWDWTSRSKSNRPWTAPVDTTFTWPDPGGAEVWLPRGYGWKWQDPLESHPFEDRTYNYGAFFNREDGLSLPMATIIDRRAGIGVSFIQSPDDVLIDLQVSTTRDGSVRFSRAFNRYGGPTHDVRFHMDIVVHEPDVRAALAAIVERYPVYFEPPNARVHEIGGGGAYSGWEGEIDAPKLAAMGFTMNWKASLDFPYMGMFLPPVKSDEVWNRFAGGGEGVYGPGDEGRYGQTTLRKMAAYSTAMRQAGFHVLNYFNVTEFGGNIVYPAPPRRARRDADLWRDPNDLLHRQLEGAVLKSPDPIWTWGKAVIMDCGDPAYRRFLLGQAKRHVETLPDSSGIAIDRMDWITRYNPNADDGVSWIDGPSRHMRRSWMSLMDELGPIMHRAGKVIFGNDMDRRLELMREVDGFYDEHGDFPFNLNTSAFLALRKPLVCWTRDDESLKPDPDAYLQRHLYLGAFPTVPYPGNDHTMLPTAWNERLYLDYGPLFNAMRGKKWVLTPGVVSVDDPAVKANVFEVPGGYLVFVGLAHRLARARVTLRGLGARAHVLYPGERDEVTLDSVVSGDSAVFDVPLKRGCALLKLARPSAQ